ncbi:peptide-methionine (R)-S-oxide reductase [Nocardioides alpinus]|uniref:peptide-methionine (R)-S-oxide reductase n=1 Tax=Nocardioides alpinus TaxID=748909 RepID=A0A1I1BCB8_9ACTN|nr:peptide-methionine (R)-S-oxide reductase MsrB [Nocardioides alpinus]PKH41281.1 peptide-methionine (R)-S-oxide reductase [Nocardioides alpinus]SFB46170.1 peptide-methionine (R)-S-oxide reductase [Nocardioides alpinus]
MFTRRRRPDPEVVHTDAEWQARLGPEAYRVLRRSGTEAPGSSPYAHPTAGADGVYRCAGCEAELFRAEDQFDSGTGWPSFSDPAARDAVEVRTDFKLLVPRREATCARCGGHLGHVFGDGPRPTGQRWCINGAALTLDETSTDPNGRTS